MEKSGLSKEILEYYYKFGQNRDLEKYFRLHGNYHKSSSEGSVNTTSEFYNKKELAISLAAISKSLDDLRIHKNKVDEKDNSNDRSFQNKQKEISFTNVNINQLPPQKQSSSTMTQTAIIQKSKGSKPSYTFSCKSNISINLPLPNTVDNSSPNKSDNQTAVATDSSFVEDEKQSICSSNDNECSKSGTSTKMEKRLEWDSLGDVGYNKSPRRKKRRNTITTLEKSVLREFFADQGIEIKFPNSEAKTERNLGVEKKKNSREKWREVLDNAKKKYSNNTEAQNDLTSNHNSFIRTAPDTHSTPIEKTAEKWSQTSLVCPSENKEIQVNITKQLQKSTDSVVSSFEYVAAHQIHYPEGSDKENQPPLSSQDLSSKQETSEEKNRFSSTESSSRKSSDVNLGVKLLCSLINAKSLNNKQKELLAKKIIAKITKKTATINSTTSNSRTASRSLPSTSPISTSHRSTTRGANVSSSPTLNNGTSSSQSMKNIQSKDLEKGVNDLKRITIEEKNQDQLSNGIEKKSSQLNNVENIDTISHIVKPIAQANDNKSSASSSNKKHLLENWLDNVTKSEILYAQRKAEQQKSASQIDLKAGGDSLVSHKNMAHISEYLQVECKNHVTWIENEIKHLENLKKLLITNNFQGNIPQEQQTTLAYPIYDKVASNRSSMVIEKAVDLHRVQSETEIINEKEKYKRKIKRTTDEVLYDKAEASTSGDVEKSEHRLKITTYTVNEEKRFPKKDYNINKPVIRQKDKKFDRSKLETPQSTVDENSSNLQDQSSESNHYSELRDGSKKQHKLDTYATSVPSSNFSSGSISLPIVQSSSGTTTTHRYDRQVGIGTQTSESVMGTEPIFGPKFNRICNKCGHTGYRCACPTIREYRPNLNKQAQVKPSAVAYIINFENKVKSVDCKSTNNYTLQECLSSNRPDFRERVHKRQQILNELKNLRKERQRKIDEIVENASDSSISQRLKLLPPPPTKHIRIFETKEMKALTKKRYKKLPEVLVKVDMELKERKKRNSRIIAHIFNKRLQRRVRKGKLSLEHSETVI